MFQKIHITFRHLLARNVVRLVGEQIFDFVIPRKDIILNPKEPCFQIIVLQQNTGLKYLRSSQCLMQVLSRAAARQPRVPPR